MMSRLVPHLIVLTRPGLPNLQVETVGPVRRQIIEEVQDRIASIIRYAYEPVHFARIRLSIHANAPGGGFAVAQANLEVGGHTVRVQAAADTTDRAVAEIADRLPVRLERLARRSEARHEGQPVAAAQATWRVARSPSEPHHLSRPASDRTLARHKVVEAQIARPEEAIFDMELLDYDIHLFVDAETGHDAVVQREGSGYRLTLCTSAPRLPLKTAIERLEITGGPHLFFRDAETNRGHVIYRRYDGNYGLIAAAGRI